MKKSESQNNNTDLIIRYLAGEASDADANKLAHWKSLSKENVQEFESIKKLWDLTHKKSTNDKIDLEYEWKQFQQKVGSKTSTNRKISSLLRYAAAIFILFVLSLLFINRMNVTTQKTQLAETKTTSLKDGSVVRLNESSSIKYKKGFGESHRKVVLKGEAFFSVKKDSNIPFQVEVNNNIIEVVGTKFNVKTDDKKGKVKVIVTEGIVKVYPVNNPEQAFVLMAEESAETNAENTGFEKLPEINLNDIAWHTKSVVFNNTSLKDAVKVLREVYLVNFDLSRSVENCLITVSFDQLDLDSVLSILETTLNLTIQKKSDKYIITGEPCLP